MSKGLYELLALFARYVFAGLMVLIVARAWRITIVDSRRAKTLRRISPETGIIGELMVLEGNEKARRGMKYKVTREGQIGSARRADIRIRHSSVRRRHAYFLLTEGGLKIRSHAGAPIRNEHGNPVKEIVLRDGDSIDIGRVQLMLILSQAPESEITPAFRKKIRHDDHLYDDPDANASDDLFEPEDDIFETHSAPGMQDHARPIRRHLPFTLEEGPSTHYTSDDLLYRRRTSANDMRLDRRTSDGPRPGIRRSGSDGFDFNDAPVADNPLNTRRSQHVSQRSNAAKPDDDEMW